MYLIDQWFFVEKKEAHFDLFVLLLLYELS